MAGDLLDLSVRDLLDEFATARPPVPGGGSAAALVTATAAAVLAMAARRSAEEWPEGRAAVAQAEALRLRSQPLAQADADAYRRALDLFERPGDPTPARDAELAAALARAAELVLRIADVASDVAELAVVVAERGDPAVRADAAAAALLAEAAARVGAHLVSVNLATTAGDERLARAEELADAAGSAAKRARAAFDRV